MIDKTGDVFFPVAQRRQINGNDVETIVEVLAEGALLESRAQILIRGGDDAHIDVYRFGTAQPLELALLQNTEQLDLYLRRHVADLVEKNRAAVGLFKLAGMRLRGAGEGTFLVAEQFGFHQIFGQGRAVDLNERRVAAGRGVVDGTCQQAFARTAFAAQQHGGAGRRDPQRGVKHILHRHAAPDDLVEVIAPPQLGLETAILETE